MKIIIQLILLVVLLGLLDQTNGTIIKGLMALKGANKVGVKSQVDCDVGTKVDVGNNIKAGILTGLGIAGSIGAGIGSAIGGAALNMQLSKGAVGSVNTNVGGNIGGSINTNIESTTRKTEIKTNVNTNIDINKDDYYKGLLDAIKGSCSSHEDLGINLNTGAYKGDKTSDLSLLYGSSNSIKTNVGSTDSKLQYYGWKNSAESESHEINLSHNKNNIIITSKLQMTNLMNKKIEVIAEMLHKLSIKKEIMIELVSKLLDLKEVALSRVVCRDDVGINVDIHSSGNIKKELITSTGSKPCGCLNV